MGSLYLCTNEATKSTRLFREKIRAFSEIVPLVKQVQEDTIREVQDKSHRFIHNLITLNAQTIQAIYRVVPQKCFGQKNREALMRIVSGKLAHSMEQTTSLIVDILKTVNLEKTEFSVYAKLFDGEPVRRRSYPIHRIFMLVMNTYWDALKDKRVAVSIGGCKDRVMVDYDTIAASLVHLLDNATKYVCPGTKLIISFRGSLETVNLIMDMVSLRIQHDEINNIFYEGYSGREPKKIGLQG